MKNTYYYAILKSVTIITKAHHYTESWDSSIPSHPISLRPILILIAHLCQVSQVASLPESSQHYVTRIQVFKAFAANWTQWSLHVRSVCLRMELIFILTWRLQYHIRFSFHTYAVCTAHLTLSARNYVNMTQNRMQENWKSRQRNNWRLTNWTQLQSGWHSCFVFNR